MAYTSIFPPDSQSGTPIYSELMQTLQVPLIGPMGSGARPETIYIDIMKSRTIGEKLIEEFDLYKVYNVGLIEHALGKLHGRLGFSLLENGLLTVTYEDRDPVRAAAIANRLVELLDEFNMTLNISRASKTTEFIEGQLEIRGKTLADAEMELKNFQEANQALELDQQLRSAMEIVGDLTGQAISLETELKILGHYTSPTSEEYTRKKREYDEVLQQLSKLKHGDGEDADLIRAYIPTLGDIPELALQLMRLKRAAEIENTVYTMLVKEYEKSRIEEARDTPTIQVMDRAEVPNMRSRPKRKMLVVVGAVVGLGWSSFLAIFVTAWRENREQSRIVTDVLSPISSDFSRIFRRK
jgi:capsular polysaccharide biosynthesis protein